MVYLTRAQRVALKKLWLERVAPESNYIMIGNMRVWLPERGISYKKFRKTVESLVAGNGCIMVCIKGLWYGIEKDGYRHT